MSEPERKYKKSTIISEGAEIKRADVSTHYINNAKFYEALLERKEKVEFAKANGLPMPRVSEYVGKCILDIANHLSTKWYFQKYPYRDDLVMNAVEHMLKYVDSFDVEKGKNPFSYFTQTAYYNFIATIRVEKKRLALRFKATLESLVRAGEWCADDPDYAMLIAEENLPDVSYMSDFVREFEESEKKKKRVKGAKVEVFDLEDAIETEVPPVEEG